MKKLFVRVVLLAFAAAMLLTMSGCFSLDIE